MTGLRLVLRTLRTEYTRKSALVVIIPSVLYDSMDMVTDMVSF